MSLVTSRRIQTGLGALTAAVGVVGLLAPARLSASTSGGNPTATDVYLTQLWTVREAALGAILLATRNAKHRRPILGVTAGLAATEAVLGLRSPAMTGSRRISAAVTPALFGAAAAYALLNDV